MNRERAKWLFKEYNRAIYLAKAGQNQEAASILRSILPDFEQVGEPNTLIKCLASLASITLKLPDFETAIKDTERVIELCKSIGDGKRVQRFSQNLTKLYLFKGEQALGTGDLDNAFESYKKARILTKETGDYRDEGRCLGNIATIYRMRKDPKLAIEFHKEALELFKAYDDTESYAMEYCNMANAYLDLKMSQRAKDIYNEILLDYSGRIKDHTQYSCIKGIAISAHQMEDWPTAKKNYAIALEISRNSYPAEGAFLEGAFKKVNRKQKL